MSSDRAVTGILCYFGVVAGLCLKHFNCCKNVAQLCTSRIFAIKWGYVSVTHSFSVIRDNIAINHTQICQKLDSYIVVVDVLLQPF